MPGRRALLLALGIGLGGCFLFLAVHSLDWRALGAALGLTPLVNVHNALIFALILVLNVSFGGAMLGWLFFTTESAG